MHKLDRRTAVKLGLAGTGLTLFCGCKALEAGASMAMQAGGLSVDQADSVIGGVKAVVKTFEDFTPEQEYYIGRTVGANILQTYKPYDNKYYNDYLNYVGNALALSSDMPETFGGYHFLALDSDEINAFAAPGGFIFVTRGMLKCCPHEDSLAAVLAHEIAHVQLKHGLQAIKNSRYSEAGIKVLSAAGSLSGADLAKAATSLGGVATDIASTMIESGYSRSYEIDADLLAMKVMKQSGYAPKGMQVLLGEMKQRVVSSGAGMFKTHPSPKSRIEELTPEFKSSKEIPQVRIQRLRSSLKRTS